MVPGIAHLRSGKCCEEKAAAPWQGGGLGEAMPEEHPKQREQQCGALSGCRSRAMGQQWVWGQGEARPCQPRHQILTSMTCCKLKS